ncbi:hypothetical protein OUZ56_026876 [Daphnia magna]|uniref:Uncharacterized protein n=1 Tax=Daphnia magna TaxID=35525 RepID=A0ABQ9ZNU9_9CRUS|nr:hypothetical protein OUZ56_026876 [Daphnia magna]
MCRLLQSNVVCNRAWKQTHGCVCRTMKDKSRRLPAQLSPQRRKDLPLRLSTGRNSKATGDIIGYVTSNKTVAKDTQKELIFSPFRLACFLSTSPPPHPAVIVVNKRKTNIRWNRGVEDTFLIF